MLAPPTYPHSPLSSLAMKTLPHLLLLLILLPQINAFRAIKGKTNRKQGKWLLSNNKLVAGNEGVDNPELKQILKQILRRHLKHCFTKQSRNGLTMTLCREDFRKLISKKHKQRKNTKHYMERIM